MFASRLLLKYAVKPVSPPRNLVPQETTKVFLHPQPAQFSTGTTRRTDYEAVKSARMPRTNKLCSRSEPKRISRKRWTQLEESILNHPNFEKAAALVQMLGDGATEKHTPHRIGSLPSGKTPFSPNADIQTIEAAVNIVKNVIEAKEAEKEAAKEAEMEEEEKEEKRVELRQREVSIPAENLNLDRPGDPAKGPRSTKPYVINIYLDTKQAKVFRDSDLKEKIREFWEEQNGAKDVSADKSREKAEEVDDEIEEKKEPPRKERRRDYSDRYDLSENVPRYQMQNITKMYPDPTSTANPHTKRLESGSPANYDINKKIKDMISSVSPVNTNGFSKYLTFWKQMWNKKQEAKEAEEIETQRTRYSSENPEDDQGKQSMKLMKNDEIFTRKQKKYNQYDPNKRSYHDHGVDEDENVNNGKYQDRSNQRYYSTSAQPNSFNGLFLGPDHSLRSKSKATTHLQIMELHNFSRQYCDNIADYESYGNFRCDPKSSNGANSKLPGGSRCKNDTSRVEEFVDKFKSALASDNKPEFKKINVVYGSNSGNSDKLHKRQVKVKISKIIDEARSESDYRSKKDGDEMKKVAEKLSRNSQSAKKK